MIGSPKPTKFSASSYFVPSVRKSAAIWRSTLSNPCRGTAMWLRRPCGGGDLLNRLASRERGFLYPYRDNGGGQV